MPRGEMRHSAHYASNGRVISLIAVHLAVSPSHRPFPPPPSLSENTHAREWSGGGEWVFFFAAVLLSPQPKQRWRAGPVSSCPSPILLFFFSSSIS